MKKSPATPTMMKIARGMSRVGRSASSARVETASNPRNESARIAAPAVIATAEMSAEKNGANENSAPFAPSTMFLMVKTTNATATTSWMMTSSTFAFAAIFTPKRLSTVHTAIVRTIQIHIGTSGKTALM